MKEHQHPFRNSELSKLYKILKNKLPFYPPFPPTINLKLANYILVHVNPEFYPFPIINFPGEATSIDSVKIITLSDQIGGEFVTPSRKINLKPMYKWNNV